MVIISSNVTSLQNINSKRCVESQIAQVQAQIDARKSSIHDIKRKQTQYKSTKQKQLHSEPISNELKVTSPSVMTSGRRDLTQLLPTTPEMICKKLELYIKRQFEKQQLINATEISQIKQLINRLPEKHDKRQSNQMVDLLLCQVKDMSIEKEKYDYKVLETQEYKEIEEYESTQRVKINQLSKRKEDLEIETRDAETNLIRRIRELYADPVVQSGVA